jgi:hypothetical protein
MYVGGSKHYLYLTQFEHKAVYHPRYIVLFCERKKDRRRLYNYPGRAGGLPEANWNKLGSKGHHKMDSEFRRIEQFALAKR